MLGKVAVLAGLLQLWAVLINNTSCNNIKQFLYHVVESGYLFNRAFLIMVYFLFF